MDENERARLAAEAWGPEQWAARATGFRELNDTLWVEVEVLSHSPCESGDDPEVGTRGWIPAHAASGAVTLWFSSRGC